MESKKKYVKIPPDMVRRIEEILSKDNSHVTVQLALGKNNEVYAYSQVRKLIAHGNAAAEE